MLHKYTRTAHDIQPFNALVFMVSLCYPPSSNHGRVFVSRFSSFVSTLVVWSWTFALVTSILTVFCHRCTFTCLLACVDGRSFLSVCQPWPSRKQKDGRYRCNVQFLAAATVLLVARADMFNRIFLYCSGASFVVHQNDISLGRDGCTVSPLPACSNGGGVKCWSANIPDSILEQCPERQSVKKRPVALHCLRFKFHRIWRVPFKTTSLTRWRCLGYDTVW